MDASWTFRIQKAKDGDTAVLGEILESFRSYLMLLARIQLRSRLQGKVGESDVVQQAYVRAFQRFSEFRGVTQEELAAWLRQILASGTANQIRHYIDTASRQTNLERSMQTELDESSRKFSSALLAGDKSPSSYMSNQERSLLLADALESLSPTYREVILARYFDELTFPQIAEKMNLSEDSVQKLWWRGLAKLRQQLRSLDDRK